MRTIKTFKNNELLIFTRNNKIKIYIDNNYEKLNIKKGYKINLINSNKGSYKGSFMNNYVCKRFISNQQVNLTNIETNKILNYCKYFLLSADEYIYSNLYNKYKYIWFLRSPHYDAADGFVFVYNDGSIYWTTAASFSYGFLPFFIKR